MNKSWMQLQNRSLPEYINGVKEFLNFAVLHKENGETIKCPCCKCNNYVSLTVDQVSDHLIVNGILRSYDPWTYHGETYSSDEHGYTNDSDYMEEDNDDMVGDGTWEMLQELNNQSLFNEWATTSTSTDVLGETPIGSNTFAKLFHDASQPLYLGCKSSKLAFIVKLLHLKILNGWSNKSFTMLLALLKDILPPGTEVPLTYYKAKEIVRDLGLHYVKIDACKNDCILFWDEFKDLDACPICKTSRYRCVSAKNTKVPHKILRYFPLKPRLQRLFVSSKTALDMRWHDEKRVNDGNLRHPADSSEWKEFDKKFPFFASEIRNVRLGLASDGFNPFDNMSTSYSMWPVILVPYNLPPWRCMKDPFLMLSLLIPGPKAPGNDIDVYLQPLVKELIELWEIGVETYDASVKEVFQMHAALLWTINDFPAYANLSGWSTKGKLACPVCNTDGSFMSLKHCKKICYLGHRRFLPFNHKMRNSKWHDGKEVRPPPKLLSGADVLEQLNDVTQPVFGKAHNGHRRRKRETSAHNWSKRSIFFELPYWSTLQVRHNLDVMHIEKNVCDSILGTLMNIEGKTKDTYKTRLDLEELGIMHELHPIHKEDAMYLPHACYMLTPSEKKKLCEFLTDVKLPDGYASNISRCVNMVDYHIHGLNSHDCHILMQRLLPIALRGFLRKDVSRAIVHLCMFFRELTSKTLKMDVLEQLDKNIAQTLSSLEKIFPPSFFDVMVHLPIHLAREAMIVGPCQFRWMYPFERYLHKLKGYVRNKAHPEGSIAEEAARHCPHNLTDQEWQLCIERFNTEAFQKISMQNKSCRGAARTNHCSGSKSFARILDEIATQEEEEEIDHAYDQIDLWYETHYNKEKNKWVDVRAQEIYEELVQLRDAQEEEQQLTVDQIFEKVLPPKSGYIRGMGVGPKPIPKKARLYSSQMEMELQQSKQREETARAREAEATMKVQQLEGRVLQMENEKNETREVLDRMQLRFDSLDRHLGPGWDNTVDTAANDEE